MTLHIEPDAAIRREIATLPYVAQILQNASLPCRRCTRSTLCRTSARSVPPMNTPTPPYVFLQAAQNKRFMCKKMVKSMC